LNKNNAPSNRSVAKLRNDSRSWSRSRRARLRRSAYADNGDAVPCALNLLKPANADTHAP